MKCIYKIKANSLNDRIFCEVCNNNVDFERFLLHTAVQILNVFYYIPLSKGASMTRFSFIYDSVIEFLSGIDSLLTEAVKPLKSDSLSLIWQTF